MKKLIVVALAVVEHSERENNIRVSTPRGERVRQELVTDSRNRAPVPFSMHRRSPAHQ